MDNYANFIKRYQVAIDYYSNVDVIPNPELTLRNQKWLEEKHGLSPVPVVHYTTDLKWLRYYMDHGYDYIALGGLVGSTSNEVCRDWVDRAFNIVCDQQSRLPKVFIHGFGVTNYRFMLRYPWYSVDSASWTKIGAFGGILVPHNRNGKFIYNEPPYIVKTSVDSPDSKLRGRHLFNLSRAEKRIVYNWLEFIRVPLGRTAPNGEVEEWGVTNRNCERKAACLLFFEEMRKSLPTYPWAFQGSGRKGFGL